MDVPFAQTIEWHNRYDIGVLAFPGPESQDVRYMFHLVAYDICEPRRLRRVAKVCEAYGMRLEKSVFTCDLPPPLFERMWMELIDEIDEEEDAVVAYRICAGCLREAESMGIVDLPKRALCYLL